MPTRDSSESSPSASSSPLSTILNSFLLVVASVHLPLHASPERPVPSCRATPSQVRSPYILLDPSTKSFASAIRSKDFHSVSDHGPVGSSGEQEAAARGAAELLTSPCAVPLSAS